MKIANFLGDSSWGDIVPETLEQGMGGKETALLNLSERWAKTGHQVINFVPISQSRTEVFENGEITYVPFTLAGSYLSNFYTDALISWEEPRIFGVPEILSKIGVGIIEMQVSHLFVEDNGINYDQYIDNYFVLSDWAGRFLKDHQPITPEKVRVLPNGVSLERYKNAEWGYPDGPYKFYYSSSPDRGLHHLLKLWPRIRETYPESELHVAYGIEHWADHVKWGHYMQAETALDVIEGLEQPGITYHGKIGQDKLAQLQMDCHALLYPCDTMQHTETGCITAVEAGAALSPIITTDCDCLEEEYGDCAAIVNLPFNPDAYLEAIQEVMDDKIVYEGYQAAGNLKAQDRDWDKIAQAWIDEISLSL